MSTPTPADKTTVITGAPEDGVLIVTIQQARDNIADYEAMRAARLAELAAEEENTDADS